MTFDDYQKFTDETDVYPKKENNFVYTLGLVGEAGEVAEKVKKIIRDDGGIMNSDTKSDIVRELGDVLWYITRFAKMLGFSLEQVAAMNIEKLQSRKDRNKLHGAGDNR